MEIFLYIILAVIIIMITVIAYHRYRERLRREETRRLWRAERDRQVIRDYPQARLAERPVRRDPPVRNDPPRRDPPRDGFSNDLLNPLNPLSPISPIWHSDPTPFESSSHSSYDSGSSYGGDSGGCDGGGGGCD